MSATTTTASRLIAVAQLTSTHSKYDNLVKIAQCAGWAQQKGCSMLFLPECCGFLGSSAAETWQAAEDDVATSGSKDGMKTNGPHLTGALLEWVATPDKTSSAADMPLSSPDVDLYNNSRVSLLDGIGHIAKASKLWISAGGVHVRAESSAKKVANTHFIFDAAGTLQASYRKIHLFDVSIPGKVDLKESKTTIPGTEPVVCHDTPLGTIGLTVCYDLRFPELYVRLVQDMGATILLVPSAFTVPTGHAHWHTLLRARAIENQCYVIAAAQFGAHNAKRTSYGHSLIIDPWGTVLKDAGGSDSTEPCPSTPYIITCDIPLDHVGSVRTQMPIQQHRETARLQQASSTPEEH